MRLGAAPAAEADAAHDATSAASFAAAAFAAAAFALAAARASKFSLRDGQWLPPPGAFEVSLHLDGYHFRAEDVAGGEREERLRPAADLRRQKKGESSVCSFGER